MTGLTLTVQLAPSLRMFLRGRARAPAVVTPYHSHASLGHVVQSLGVPLPEVGDLYVADVAVPPSYRPAPGDTVVAVAVARPQPLAGPPRFLLDVHLGALARRLRVLGVDAAYRNRAEDADLVAQAAAEDRLLLTQDRGLLLRRGLRRAAYVRGAGPDAQLHDVLDRFALPLAPFTRCTACGGPRRGVPKTAVLDRLRPGTRRSYDVYAECQRCGQIYWQGAHARRLGALVRSVARDGGTGGGTGDGGTGREGAGSDGAGREGRAERGASEEN